MSYDIVSIITSSTAAGVKPSLPLKLISWNGGVAKFKVIAISLSLNASVASPILRIITGLKYL